MIVVWSLRAHTELPCFKPTDKSWSGNVKKKKKKKNQLKHVLWHEMFGSQFNFSCQNKVNIKERT